MFQSQTALVTGAAQGIGAAIAHALAQAGVKLALLDIQEEPLVNTAEQLRAQGATVRTYPVNIADRTQVANCMEDLAAHLGPIHILVNVAGVLRISPILSLPPQDWQHTLNVNLNGVFNISQMVALHMVQHRIQGRIVSVSSNAASTPRMGMAAYAASKAAVTQFTKCLGLELAPHGIRCNIVSPGSTDTPMQQQFTPTPESQQQVLHGNLEQHRLGIPLQRIASPQDIANSVMFLLSDQARHITMHDLRVDGGATLGG